MSERLWSEVDAWIAKWLVGTEPAMAAILEANAAAGLPPIDVSPLQGKLLHLLVRIAGARRVLEVGTLGGYSTAWLALALPEGGRVVTLEVDPKSAEVARANLRLMGLEERVEVLLGPAIETLQHLSASCCEPFDFVFIDADKKNNSGYLRLALRLSKPGTVIVCDNVVREGRVIERSADEAVLGTQAMFEALRDEPRLTATALQTVGAKGWDGFAVALVEAAG